MVVYASCLHSHEYGQNSGPRRDGGHSHPSTNGDSMACIDCANEQTRDVVVFVIYIPHFFEERMTKGIIRPPYALWQIELVNHVSALIFSFSLRASSALPLVYTLGKPWVASTTCCLLCNKLKHVVATCGPSARP